MVSDGYGFVLVRAIAWANVSLPLMGALDCFHASSLFTSGLAMGLVGFITA